MESSNRLRHIFDCLAQYRRIWLIPLILGLIASMVYSFILMSETWTARQSMILRDDLLGETFKPGQFLSEEAMKSAQETILETARRPEVIRETLKKLGPEREALFGIGAGNWPDEETIEEARGIVSFESANGGEIGKSEVIILAAKASSPQRAEKFLSILLDEVDSKLTEFRASRFRSMQNELSATRESARQSKDELAARLQKLEKELGAKVMLIKAIDDKGGSPGAFENTMQEIETEKRAASRQLATAVALRDSLLEAQRNPRAQLPTSGDLLAFQPSFSELLIGLATATRELSVAEGRYKKRHPAVMRARDTVNAAKKKIQENVPSAIDGLNGQIRNLEDLVRMSEAETNRHEAELRTLTPQRVEYRALKQEVEKRSEDLLKASKRLAEVKARSETAHAVQLLTRMGEPHVGTRPDGLGKKAMVLLGGIGGLIIGLGLVLLVAPPFDEPIAELHPTSDRRQQPAPSRRTTNPLAPVPTPPAPAPVAPAPPVATAPAPPVVTAPAPPVAQAPVPPVAKSPVSVASAATVAATAAVSASVASIVAPAAKPQESVRPPAPLAPPVNTQAAPTLVPPTPTPAAPSVPATETTKRSLNEKVEAITSDLQKSSATEPSKKSQVNYSETIQISDDTMPTTRNSARPIELAKSVEQQEQSDNQSVLDNVFSKMSPAGTLPLGAAAANSSQAKDMLAGKILEPTRREVESAEVPPAELPAMAPKFEPREDVGTVGDPELPASDAPAAETVERERKQIETAQPPTNPTPDVSIPQLIRKLQDSKTTFGP